MTAATDERRKVYRAHINYQCSRGRAVSVFCTYGYLSPCGEWVEGNDIRWRRTPEWCDTEAEAAARVAPEIAEIGALMVKQAHDLLEAGRPKEAVAS